MSSSNNIFKVNNIIETGIIKEIYVFYDFEFSFNNSNNLTTSFEMLINSPNVDFNKILTQLDNMNIENAFSYEELVYIHTNNTKVIFVNQLLHIDDSIYTTKLKIIEAMNNNVCMECIYLFCHSAERVFAMSVFKQLTNSFGEISRNDFMNYLRNIKYNEDFTDFNLINTIPNDKNIFTYNDILELGIDNKIFIFEKILGEKTIEESQKYSQITNPLKYDKNILSANVFSQSSEKSYATLDGSLILNTGLIIKNNIYICLYNNVYNVSTNDEQQQKIFIEIYYSQLLKSGINSFLDFEKNEQNIINISKEKINNSLLIGYKNINMFYDIYYTWY